MTKRIINKLVLIIAYVSLVACNDRPSNPSVVTEELESLPVIINGASMSQITEKQLNPQSTHHLSDDSYLSTLHIEPHKVECQGYHLKQCLLKLDPETNEMVYFYEPIEGFNYQWGYSYELLVRVTSKKPLMSDTYSQHYELVDIRYMSPYNSKASTFEYKANFGEMSITKHEPGFFQLVNQKTVACDPDMCDAIDSALAQEQGILMTLRYGTRPDDPLVLVSIDCVESYSTFLELCTTENKSYQRTL